MKDGGNVPLMGWEKISSCLPLVVLWFATYSFVYMSTLLSLSPLCITPSRVLSNAGERGFFCDRVLRWAGEKNKKMTKSLFFPLLLGHKQVRTNGMAVVCCGVLVIEFWKLGIEGIRFGAFFHTRFLF